MTHSHLSDCVRVISEHNIIPQVLCPENASAYLREQSQGGALSYSARCHSLSTFTVDSDVNWTFMGMMKATVKQRPDSSPETEGTQKL